MATVTRAGSGQSQEPEASSSFPSGYRDPSSWPISYCFHKLHAGSFWFPKVSLLINLVVKLLFSQVPDRSCKVNYNFVKGAVLWELLEELIKNLNSEASVLSLVNFNLVVICIFAKALKVFCFFFFFNDKIVLGNTDI